jgi:succinate dehydrogenase/fumarate reductase flavoprotein subunit/uncharacterized protein with FMN-binding domain
MSKFRKTGIGAVLLVLILGLVFTGCGDSGSGSVINVETRKSVADGIYVTTAQGYSPHTPVTVETTLINNYIIRLRILDNAETVFMRTAVEDYLVPRIIQTNSLVGYDAVSGATFTSLGVKNAIAAAIDKAGGNPEEWYDEPPKPRGTVKLPEDGEYDVIVVGLGGTGTAAYASASEAVTVNGTPIYPSVFGIEASAKVGGSSIAASGPFEVSENGREQFLQHWRKYALRSNLDEYAQTTDGYRHKGNGKENLFKILLSGGTETIHWLADEYGWGFAPDDPGADWSNTMSSMHMITGSDTDKVDWYNNTLNTARDRNPKNRYMTELKATELIMLDGKVRGVKATHKPTGTTYNIYGKTVILGTGGFIGNPDMTRQYLGGLTFKSYAVPHTGDGIKMAVEQAEAGAYNIETAPVQHLIFMENYARDAIIHPVTKQDLSTKYVDGYASGGFGPATPVRTTEDLVWKSTLNHLLLRPQNAVIGLYNTIWNEFWPGTGAGKRFIDEFDANGYGGEGPGMAFPPIALNTWKGGGHVAAIFCGDMVEAARTQTARIPNTVMHINYGVLPPDPPFSNYFSAAEFSYMLDAGISSGNAIKGTTFTEFASKLHEKYPDITEATLRATMESWNTTINSGGTDGFGRNLSTSGATKFNFENGPYYAIIGAGYYYGTGGGLDVDEDMQVLHKSSTKTNQVKIPGLYAGGYDTLGNIQIYQDGYTQFGGTVWGWALTSGRIAGRNAVVEALGL